MNQNKKIVGSGGPTQGQDRLSRGIHNNGVSENGLWMEFEESFIQALSGIEPVKKYYSTLATAMANSLLE